jgi:hypothetical protein
VDDVLARQVIEKHVAKNRHKRLDSLRGLTAEYEAIIEMRNNVRMVEGISRSCYGPLTALLAAARQLVRRPTYLCRTIIPISLGATRMLQT